MEESKSITSNANHKLKDGLVFSIAIVFSYLFYQQSNGLNLFLFDSVFISSILFAQPLLRHNRYWLWTAILTVISGISSFLYGSDLSLVANIFCLLILSGISSHVNFSFPSALLLSTISHITSPIMFLLNNMNTINSNNQNNKVNKAIYVLPLCILTIFFFIYRAANPLF